MNAKATNDFTLEDCLIKAVSDGFSETFRVTDAGMSTAFGKRIYQPDEVVINSVCHFDQNANARNNSALYQLTTLDGRKGILIDSYGSYYNEKLNRFLQDVKHAEPDDKKHTSLSITINNVFARLKNFLSPAA